MNTHWGETFPVQPVTSLSQNGLLTCREAIHGGEKPFECAYCEKCFATGSNCKVHHAMRKYKLEEKLNAAI